MRKLKQYACSISAQRVYFDFRHDVCIVEAVNKPAAYALALHEAQRRWPDLVEKRYSVRVLLIRATAPAAVEVAESSSDRQTPAPDA